MEHGVRGAMFGDAVEGERLFAGHWMWIVRRGSSLINSMSFVIPLLLPGVAG